MRSAAEELETSKEELQSTNEELTTVNQELKSSVDELGRANGDLQNLMASTEIGTIFLDRQLRIKRYTPQTRELFNIIPTDVGRPLSDITHKLNHHSFSEDAERVLTTLVRSEREVRNDGHYFLARIVPYRTLDDYIDGVVLTFIDITERKKAEQALREAETQMRLIVESARDYAIFTTDLQRRVSSWNAGAQALFGYEEAEIMGRRGDILFTPEDREAGAPQWETETAQATGRAENERRHIRKDGSRFYGSGVVTPLRDDAENHIGFVKVMRDLTEQKRAEEALAASEEQFRRAIQEAPVPTIMQAEDGEVLQISRTWTELTGYELGDLPTFDTWLNLAYGEGADAVRAHMHDLFQGTQRILNVEFSILTRDQSPRHWSFSASSPGVLRDGRRFIVGMALDITERKQAEEALRASEQRLHRMVNVPRVGVLTFDFSGALLSVNDAFLAMMEYSREEFAARTFTWQDFTPPEYVEASLQEIESVQQTGLAGPYEKEYFRRDGSRIWLMFVAAGLGDGILVEYAVDISDRKRAEEALRESEERARALIENLPGGAAFIVDRDLRYLLADGEALTTVGFTPQDFVGKTVFEALPSELATQYEPMFRKALAGEPFEQEHLAHEHWFLSRGVPLIDTNGAVYAVLALSYDITRRKQAEAGLRESEERLRIAVESADMGTWDWNLLTNEVRWNARHFTLLGMEPQAHPIAPEEFFRHVHPDDLDRVRQRLEQTLRDRVVFEAEFRIVREGGGVCWMNGYGNVVEEANGQPMRVSGAMIDITRRKDVEEALRLGEERYRLTVENIRDYAIFTLDTEGHVTSWSEGARRVKGYEPHEIIGQHFRVFYIPEDQESRKPEHELEHASATGRNEDESWRVRKDGSRFWGNEISTAMRDETGVLRGFVKISRNLTERKRAEEERIALEHETTLLTERNRMAQELHDTLAQGFTGIRMQLEMAQSALQATPPETEDGLKRVARASEIAQSSHQEARRSIRALRSPLLENATLPEALERLVIEVSDSVKVGFALEGAPLLLSALVENDLYRIGQESVTNAVRHSGAKRIVLTLTYFDDQVHVSIVDDGRGFDPQGARAGFGVTGMQERARRLGADLQITSWPGRGTQVNLEYHIPAGQGRPAT